MLGILRDIGTAACRLFERQVQARRLRRERRRFDRLYGPTHVKAVPAPMGAHRQAERLAGIVSDYCRRGQAIADVHNAACVKLDAAEYAFASLLRDLSSVMDDAPSTWTPARASLPNERVVDHGMRAIAA